MSIKPYVLILLFCAPLFLTGCGHRWVNTTAVAISPDGEKIVATCYTYFKVGDGNSDRKAFGTVWDANGNVAFQLDNVLLPQGNPHRRYLRFIKDGTEIISASSGTVTLYDTQTGKVLRSFRVRSEYDIESVVFTADEKYALIQDEHWRIFQVDVQTGETIKTIEKCRYNYQAGSPSVILSPDGKSFAVCDPLSSTHNLREVRIYDIETENLIRRLPIPAEIRSADFSHNHRSVFTPDGKRIIICLSSYIVVFDLEKQENNIKTLGGVDIGDVVPGYRSPLATNGQTLVVGSGRGEVGTGIVAVNLTTGKRLTFGKHLGRATSIAISPDGKHVLSSCGPTKEIKEPGILYWDIETGEIKRIFQVP